MTRRRARINGETRLSVPVREGGASTVTGLEAAAARAGTRQRGRRRWGGGAWRRRGRSTERPALCCSAAYRGDIRTTSPASSTTPLPTQPLRSPPPLAARATRTSRCLRPRAAVECGPCRRRGARAAGCGRICSGRWTGA